MMEMTTINHDSNPNQIWIKCGEHKQLKKFKSSQETFRLTTEGVQTSWVDFCAYPATIENNQQPTNQHPTN